MRWDAKEKNPKGERKQSSHTDKGKSQEEKEGLEGASQEPGRRSGGSWSLTENDTHGRSRRLSQKAVHDHINFKQE